MSQWRNPRPGSPNKVPFFAAVQTTKGGQAVRVCLSMRSHTNESMMKFIAYSLALPVTLVSDGLSCFSAVAASGGVHERIVTGGGKAAVKLPQFRAVSVSVRRTHLELGLRGDNDPVQLTNG